MYVVNKYIACSGHMFRAQLKNSLLMLSPWLKKLEEKKELSILRINGFLIRYR